MRTCLVAAGVYNLAWGSLTVLWPMWLFQLAALEPPNHPFIWQCVGMIVGVYGIGYLAASTDPVRHWPIVLVLTDDRVPGGRTAAIAARAAVTALAAGVMYRVVERWRVCYRDPVWDSTAGVWVYPDGQPCDGGGNGQICPPGSFGRSVTMSGIER
mgnify:CR=1 FL=1